MRRRSFVFSLLALGSSVLWLATPKALAQETRGQILGRVVDSSGAVVPGATLKALNTDPKVEASSATNDSGDYILPFLLSGTYNVSAEMKGFKTSVEKGVLVRLADKITLNITLEIGQATEKVNVSAESPIIEAASASMGTVVDRRTIQELPLKDGSPLVFIQFAAGVQNLSTGAFSRPFDTSAGSVSVNGSRSGTNEFTLDGAPNAQGGQIAYTPPIDSVQEFKMQTATFDASTGFVPGGVMNLSLKSGTNSLHGSAWDFVQNTAFNANDFFNNRAGQPKVPVKMNRYGTSVGGPLYLGKLYDGRNRTFWMYTYEGIRNAGRESPTTSSVPTPPELKGDFSALLKLGAQYQIYDPATTAPAASGLFSRQPFPGNVIPANRINPVAAKEVTFYEPANQAGNADGSSNWYTPDPEKDYYNSHVFRVDRTISDKNRFFLRGHDSKRIQDYRHRWNGALSLWEPRINYGLAVDDVHTFSSTFLMNVRYSYGAYRQGSFPANGYRPSYAPPPTVAELGFSPVYVSQINAIFPKASTIFPGISPSGYASIDGTSYSQSHNATHDATANFTRMIGGHTLRFGTGYRAYQRNSWSYGAAAGSFSFDSSWDNGPLSNSSSAPIGQGLAALLLGLPSQSSSLPVNASYASVSKFWSASFQDDWKVTSKLTLNLGLRYELEFPTTERYDRSVLGFDATSPSPLQAAAKVNYALNPITQVPVGQFQVLGGLTFAGVGGNPRGLWQMNKANFMPRFGLAYSPNSKTVVRGGYGRYYDTIGVQRRVVTQTGFSTTTNFVGSVDNGQTFTANLTNPFPTGISLPVGASGGLATNMGNSISFFNTGLNNPYVHRFQISLQRQLPGKAVVEVAYVGNRGKNLLVTQDLDAIPAQFLSTSPVRDQATINLLTGQVANPFYPLLPRTSLSGSTVARSQLLRPYPQFTGVSRQNNLGTSGYNSMQTRFDKRMDKGLLLSVAWTWSKFIEATSYLNPTDAMPSRVISDQDRTHHVSVTGIYELPVGRGKKWGGSVHGLADKVISDWQLQTAWQLQSGAAIGFGNALLQPGSTLSDIPLPASQRTVQRWFNTAAFVTASAQQLANNIQTMSVRFSGVRADRMNMFDLSAIKNIAITEHVRLQFNAMFVNAPNHANYTAPTTTPTSTAFGQVGSTAQYPRAIEFGLKLVF